MKKVLIVEDEASYATLLRDELSAKGYEVNIASDGKKGLVASLKQQPDLILLDIRMPTMDGLAMLAMLREDPYGKTAKVILLTNLEPSEDIIEKVINTQPACYLVKSDTHIDELLGKVKEVLDS